MNDTLVSSEVVEPYAQAYMSLAQGNKLADRFGEDVFFLRELLAQSDELKQFLASPLIRPESKKAVLRQLTGDQVHPFTLNFLFLLVDRRRILFLDAVCKQYQALLRQLNKTVLAEVISAVELTDDQREAVRRKVIEISGAQQVELETSIDPDIVGGVVIKVGSQVLDASLRGQLRRIGLRLSSGM